MIQESLKQGLCLSSDPQRTRGSPGVSPPLKGGKGVYNSEFNSLRVKIPKLATFDLDITAK